MIRLPRPASAPYLRPVGNCVVYFIWRTTTYENKRLAYMDVGAEVQSGTMNLCSNSFFLATK